MAPVCDAAAACPASDVPTFSAMTGFPASRASVSAAMSRPASRQASKQHRMTLVAGSRAIQAMPSAMSMSHSLPVVMKRLMPAPRSLAMRMV